MSDSVGSERAVAKEQARARIDALSKALWNAGVRNYPDVQGGLTGRPEGAIYPDDPAVPELKFFIDLDEAELVIETVVFFDVPDMELDNFNLCDFTDAAVVAYVLKVRDWMKQRPRLDDVASGTTEGVPNVG